MGWRRSHDELVDWTDGEVDRLDERADQAQGLTFAVALAAGQRFAELDDTIGQVAEAATDGFRSTRSALRMVDRRCNHLDARLTDTARDWQWQADANRRSILRCADSNQRTRRQVDDHAEGIAAIAEYVDHLVARLADADRRIADLTDRLDRLDAQALTESGHVLSADCPCGPTVEPAPVDDGPWFGVGDRVIVTDETGYDGEQGVIAGAAHAYDCKVAMDCDGDIWPCDWHELTLA